MEKNTICGITIPINTRKHLNVYSNEQLFNGDTMEGKCKCYPAEDVAEDMKEYLDSELMYDLADFFKLFGDSTRIRILTALGKQEMCVCTLSDLLGMSMSAVSHQLRSLKQTKLVRSRKEGKNVYYALDDHHVKDILETATEHIEE